MDTEQVNEILRLLKIIADSSTAVVDLINYQNTDLLACL